MPDSSSRRSSIMPGLMQTLLDSLFAVPEHSSAQVEVYHVLPHLHAIVRGTTSTDTSTE